MRWCSGGESTTINLLRDFELLARCGRAVRWPSAYGAVCRHDPAGSEILDAGARGARLCRCVGSI
ncbi:hypothetical protein BZL29_8489 [Mycobacterium kansasii]|uniref:Uncharacterized protein n=1 Tax=Mycobacterium kansasii TaxID=1768 RepID=A0A1V3WB88_MYCKA|nr:hypothetical protein BZL29_8489 [Mycobacterium kansasii]